MCGARGTQLNVCWELANSRKLDKQSVPKKESLSLT